MILLKWWLIKPCQSSFKRLLNIEPGWYTYLTDPQSISYHFMVNPLHFLTAKQRHIQLQDSHTCMWGSNFTKHRLVKIILKNFPGYFFLKKKQNKQTPYKRSQHNVQLTLSFEVLKKIGQWMNKVHWWFRGSSLWGSTVTKPFLWPGLSEPFAMIAQVSS